MLLGSPSAVKNSTERETASLQQEQEVFAEKAVNQKKKNLYKVNIIRFTKAVFVL